MKSDLAFGAIPVVSNVSLFLCLETADWSQEVESSVRK